MFRTISPCDFSKDNESFMVHADEYVGGVGHAWSHSKDSGVQVLKLCFGKYYQKKIA